MSKEYRRLTSFAVKVQDAEDTSTTALRVAVGDTRRARAGENVTGSNLGGLSRSGNGQSGESEESGQLHLEESFAKYCISTVTEACDGDNEKKSNLKLDKGPLFMLRKVGSASPISHECLFCFVEYHYHRLDLLMSGNCAAD